MIGWFKCKHPAAALRVARPETVVNVDEDFNSITYHLSCGHCGEPVDVHYSQLIGGVEAFLTRGHRVRAVDEQPRPRWLGARS